MANGRIIGIRINKGSNGEKRQKNDIIRKKVEEEWKEGQ